MQLRELQIEKTRLEDADAVADSGSDSDSDSGEE